MPDLTVTTRFNSGDLIDGRYSIVNFLGAGEFGEVYLATDTLHESQGNFDERSKVILKIVRARGAEGQLVGLVREAEISRGLSHDRIADLFRFDRFDDSVYLVREYVPGETLADLLRGKNKLPFPEALSIAMQVAEGLKYLHERNVVHRDLKPSNIIIDDQGQVTLVDFSVAGQLRNLSGMTKPGEVFGTPLYMAPEQWRGAEQGPSTDVYALGLLFYEMLAGQPLFDSAGMVERIGASLATEVRVTNPDIPRRAARFIERCVQQSPARRPATGGEALELLRATASRPEARRSTQFATILAVCLFLAGAASVLYFWNESLIRIPNLPWMLAGFALIMLGALLGQLVRRLTVSKVDAVKREAESVAHGATRREKLTHTLALQIDELVASVKKLDESILARTVALMLEEYQGAMDSADRRDALAKSADLLEKLMDRMTPWYVRYQKLLVMLTTGLGVVTGTLSIVKSFTA